jgi:rubrerythrin
MKGSRTEKNLACSFAGESMARNKYTYYASKAQKEGHEQISSIFLETAINETEHAKLFLKAIGGHGGGVNIQTTVGAFKIGTTLENLKDASAGEREEHTTVYPKFAEIADQEGFKDVAELFRKIGSIEKEHETRYNLLASQLESGNLYKRNRSIRWKCRNCGYVVDANEAPEKCPVCGHPQGWFEMKEVLE